jgi:hypothetical protein
MTPPTAAVVGEPVSPELVLVSPPEVAQLARAQLPDPSIPFWVTAVGLDAVPEYPPPVLPLPLQSRPRRWTVQRVAFAVLAVIAIAASLAFAPTGVENRTPTPWRSLNGVDNNVEHPTWGRIGTHYRRIAKAYYADGISAMPKGLPPARYISNRVFNDLGQNVFSENDISQWGWVWGQFLDHTFGLRDEKPGATTPIPFAKNDPLERFRDDLGVIAFSRTRPAPGTGVTNPRQQVNTVNSYIDAYAVYGGTNARLDWLRVGPIDGDPTNNSAYLMLPGNYLPQQDTRGSDDAAKPGMDLMGQLVTHPATAAVAGDVRANENDALTAVHTLFAREHNRIVSLLPSSLTDEEKFQIARRVVGAEQQYVTYHEFLPALGVKLPPYRGYDQAVDPAISDEFATVGYRVHSMVHGELEPKAPASTYTQEQLKAFRSVGIEVEREDGEITLVIPLGVAYGNPELLKAVGLGAMLEGLADERQYKNDEQIDDSMRSILFQIPKPGVRDPSVCGEPVVNPKCYSDVQDLGAIDIERGRDHGIPPYNRLRIAYGLAPKTSYTAITRESTARFPRGGLIRKHDPIDDPDILAFKQLRDDHGHVVRPKSDEAQEDVVSAVRRSTLAARLKAVYGAGNVNEVDAFVGMLSEPHVKGTEFGELQLAMWKRQFQALRDGDRFFYLNDPMLTEIREKYGIDYRHTLAEIIRMDSDATVGPHVFKAPAS